ncbi:MAG: hypothetical protein ACWA5L_06055 [bacterium]
MMGISKILLIFSGVVLTPVVSAQSLESLELDGGERNRAEEALPAITSAVPICTAERKISEHYRGTFSLIQNPTPPSYPERCKFLGSETERYSVDLMFDISLEGKAENICLLRSDQNCFNKYAVQAVRNYNFTPFRLNGNVMELENTALRLTYVLMDEAPDE